MFIIVSLQVNCYNIHHSQNCLICRLKCRSFIRSRATLSIFFRNRLYFQVESKTSSYYLSYNHFSDNDPNKLIGVPQILPV